MSVATPSINSGLSAGRIALPLLSLVAMFIAWQSGHRWAAFVLFGLILMAIVTIPRIVRRKLEIFDKQAMRLLATGRSGEVEALAKSNVFLAMFGARGCLDGKVGLAMLETGRYAQAAWRLSSALPCASGPAILPLKAGLCKAYLLTNQPAHAEAQAAALSNTGVALPEVQAVRAVAAFLLGKHDVAGDHAKGARTLSHSADVGLMLDLLDIELALARGREMELAQGADSSQPYLRAWIHLVRGKLRHLKGKTAQAQASFAKAAELDKGGFVGAAARRMLERPAEAEANPVGTAGRDPLVARKKRRK